MSENIQELLEHHWAMDELAAQTLAERLPSEGVDHLTSICENLGNLATNLRDGHRRTLGNIYSGQSRKKLLAGGPCSGDNETDIEPVLDLLQEIHEDRPDVEVVYRLGGSKPRSGAASGNWRGLFNSIVRSDQESLYATYRQVYERGIGIISEFTDPIYLGALAPYLSGDWLGSRHMTSSDLRAVISGIHLSSLIKNDLSGDPDHIKRALAATRSNSEENLGSGFQLGTIGSTPNHLGYPTGVLPVGTGNYQVGIVARGYELHKHTTRDERREKVAAHISALCGIAEQFDSAVIIDGSHKVPPMYDIDAAIGDRFFEVMEKIRRSMEDGEISDMDRIRGVMVELSTNEGRTDKNMVIGPDTKEKLLDIMDNLPNGHHSKSAA